MHVAGHYAYTPPACRARRKKMDNQAVEDMCLYGVTVPHHLVGRPASGASFMA